MKALVKTARGVGNIELQDIERPIPGRGEALIEVAAAGICGTDMHIRQNHSFYTPPVVLGHEYAGTVIELGEGVSNISIGDRVTSPATQYCGQCYQCKNDWPAFALRTVKVLGQSVKMCPQCFKARQQLTLFYDDEGQK